ncbi:MAG: tail-specific protease [bacterium]|nr:tail-specific protease [bacterium]
MRTYSKRSLVGPSVVLGLLLAPLAARMQDGAVVAEPAQDAFAPTRDMERTTRTVLSRLDSMHVRDFELDDSLSSEVLDQYIDYLDPRREVFLASDVAEFQSLRTKLDDAFKAGILEPGFAMFQRYHERRLDRTRLLARLVEQSLDELSFEEPDALELDREDAAWAATRADWDALWMRRFKNDVLTLRLADRSPEEIEKILARRYTNELARIERMNAGDVHGLFVNALTATLDPHTQYFPPRAAEDFDMQMSLSFEGIGARLNSEDGYVKITEIIPGGPAESSRALGPGDRILSVAQGPDADDADEPVDIIGWMATEAVDLIRGPKGSTVRLEILPAEASEGGATRTVAIERATIQLEDQAATKLVVEIEGDEGERPLKIGVIELPAFYMDFQAYSARDRDYRSSTRDVAKLLTELQQEGVDGVVLDLRNNSGGSLIEATEISSLFLGRKPVVQVHDKRGETQVLGGERETFYKGPMAVLVNRLSASASEILAGAIQDHGRGLILGTRTFGKGSVQTLLPMKVGELKLTQAQFYRVTGRGTQRHGIEPDVVFPPIFDPKEFGEDALENALPWDTIKPTAYDENPIPVSAKREIARRHTERSTVDPEFIALRRRLARIARDDGNETLSLVESERIAKREKSEKELLEIENARRKALGLDAIESFDDLGDEDVVENEADAYQSEAAQVLADWIEVMGARIADRR